MGINLPHRSFTNPQNYVICLQNFQSFNKFAETYRKQKRIFRNGDGFVVFLTWPTPVLWGQENSASCGPVENEGKSARYRTDQFYLREFLSHKEIIALTPSLQKYLVVAFAFYSAFFCTIPYKDTFAKSDMCHPSEHLLFPVKRSLADDKSFYFKAIVVGYTSKPSELSLCKSLRIVAS